MGRGTQCVVQGKMCTDDGRSSQCSEIELRPPGTLLRGAVHPPWSSPPQGKTGRMMRDYRGWINGSIALRQVSKKRYRLLGMCSEIPRTYDHRVKRIIQGARLGVLGGKNETTLSM